MHHPPGHRPCVGVHVGGSCGAHPPCRQGQLCRFRRQEVMAARGTCSWWFGTEQAKYRQQQRHQGGQGQHTGQRRPWKPPPGVARSRLHCQNTTRASPTTPYNAITHSSPGGALTNTVTSTNDSGSTATPPPTRSIDTVDHN